jgi:hypothetical protein
MKKVFAQALAALGVLGAAAELTPGGGLAPRALLRPLSIRGPRPFQLTPRAWMRGLNSRIRAIPIQLKSTCTTNCGQIVSHGRT